MKYNEIEVVGSYKTPVGHSTMIYLLFQELPVARKEYYQFKQYAEIDKHTMRGFNTYVGDGAISYATTVVVQGVEYNVISPLDSKGVEISFADKKNDKIIYRYPFFMGINIVGEQFERRIWMFKPNSGNSFVEFSFVPVITIAPFCLPINFVWDK